VAVGLAAGILLTRAAENNEAPAQVSYFVVKLLP